MLVGNKWGPSIDEIGHKSRKFHPYSASTTMNKKKYRLEKSYRPNSRLIFDFWLENKHVPMLLFLIVHKQQKPFFYTPNNL